MIKRLFLTVSLPIGGLLLAPVEWFLRKLRLVVLTREFGAIGDNLVMTSVVDFFAQRKGYRSIVVAFNRDFFLHNPNVVKAFSYPDLPLLIRGFIRALCYFSRQKNLILYRYRDPLGRTQEEVLRQTSDDPHLRAIHVMHTPYFKEIRSDPHIRNQIHFSAEEAGVFQANFRTLPARFAVICSQAQKSSLGTKDWGAEKMQQVVLETLHRINWIQLGTHQEPVLRGITLDLRGMTTLRELAYLVSKAQLVLSNEGLFIHLSGTFDIPAVGIYPGTFPLQLSAYPRCSSVTLTPPLPCSYCWELQHCPEFDEPRCIKEIPVKQVVDQVLARIEAQSVEPSDRLT